MRSFLDKYGRKLRSDLCSGITKFFWTSMVASYVVLGIAKFFRASMIASYVPTCAPELPSCSRSVSRTRGFVLWKCQVFRDKYGRKLRVASFLDKYGRRLRDRLCSGLLPSFSGQVCFASYVISFVLDFCQVCLASMVASYVISFALDICLVSWTSLDASYVISCALDFCRLLLHKYGRVHPFFVVIV